MSNDYSTEAQEVADAMNSVYENKQQNKKNDITGDFSTDNVSYPTAKAVKNWVDSQGFLTQHQSISGKEDNSNKVSSWSGTLTDTHYPSEKLTKQSIDSKTITVEEQSTAESGFAKTYIIKQGNVQVGSKINIPKDFLVRSGEVKTCTVPNVPVQDYKVGDKYLDFVVNAKDSSSTDEHIYILVSDIGGTTYEADNTTLQLNNGTFSIKSGGVGANQIAATVKNSWLTSTDIEEEVSAFASALANAINPQS